MLDCGAISVIGSMHVINFDCRDTDALVDGVKDYRVLNIKITDLYFTFLSRTVDNVLSNQYSVIRNWAFNTHNPDVYAKDFITVSR